MENVEEFKFVKWKASACFTRNHKSKFRQTADFSLDLKGVEIFIFLHVQLIVDAVAIPLRANAQV